MNSWDTFCNSDIAHLVFSHAPSLIKGLKPTLNSRFTQMCSFSITLQSFLVIFLHWMGSIVAFQYRIYDTLLCLLVFFFVIYIEWQLFSTKSSILVYLIVKERKNKCVHGHEQECRNECMAWIGISGVQGYTTLVTGLGFNSHSSLTIVIIVCL